MAEPTFKISSYCANGGCVAVAALSDGSIAIRDSKAAAGPVLSFTPDEWDTFIAGVRSGEFDRSALQAP